MQEPKESSHPKLLKVVTGEWPVTFDGIVARMQIEIAADMKSGAVGPGVRTFGELHDYVDANCYGGFCDDEYVALLRERLGGDDALIRMMNRCQDRLSDLLQSGVLAANAIPRLTQEELEDVACRHFEWLASTGKRGAQADFAGKDLSGLDFHGMNLSHGNFEGAILSHASLMSANFNFGKFKGADLSGAVCRDASFYGADFTDAGLSGVDMEGANLARAVMPESARQEASPWKGTASTAPTACGMGMGV